MESQEVQDQLLLATEYVRRHYPEMADVEPTRSHPAPGVTVFTFRKTFTTPDGAQLAQVVQVSVSDDGRVLKAVVSK